MVDIDYYEVFGVEKGAEEQEPAEPANTEPAGEKEQENSRYFEENRREVIKIVDKIIGKDAGEK